MNIKGTEINKRNLQFSASECFGMHVSSWMEGKYKEGLKLKVKDVHTGDVAIKTMSHQSSPIFGNNH